MHYMNNRQGRTGATFLARQMEKWLHKKVAATASPELDTLEIGAGTLNQLDFESSLNYDVVEPYHFLYQDSPNFFKVRHFYDDISEIREKEIYDRIISVACFEHICDLHEVVKKCAVLVKKGGVLGVSIPNEGRFLWHFAYRMTTRREFRRKYGLDYEVLMRYEHVNSADEIEIILKHFFKTVSHSYMGIGKDLSFYRYYECRDPVVTGG